MIGYSIDNSPSRSASTIANVKTPYRAYPAISGTSVARPTRLGTKWPGLMPILIRICAAAPNTVHAATITAALRRAAATSGEMLDFELVTDTLKSAELPSPAGHKTEYQGFTIK